MPDFDKLREEVAAVHQLLIGDDYQPGLVTWAILFCQRWKAIADMWYGDKREAEQGRIRHLEAALHHIRTNIREGGFVCYESIAKFAEDTLQSGQQQDKQDPNYTPNLHG